MLLLLLGMNRPAALPPPLLGGTATVLRLGAAAYVLQPAAATATTSRLGGRAQRT
jgi:hypothetical protein